MHSIFHMSDQTRLKKEYSRREHDQKYTFLYSQLNKSYLFMIQQRARDTITLLGKQLEEGIADKKILEVGCGKGKIMQEYISLGAANRNLFGMDLILERINVGKNDTGNFLQGDGQKIPLPNNYFDYVLQYTMFSSILDNSIKSNIAKEMLRVLKANGTIIWYDFFINPSNSHTKGINKREIQNLFPDCSFEIQKITLAPPIARKLVPVSWILALFLEKLKVFNSHYLVSIRPT